MQKYTMPAREAPSSFSPLASARSSSSLPRNTRWPIFAMTAMSTRSFTSGSSTNVCT
ncbi:hypothetical protein CORTU0001_0522 [Corynebacterium tuberculostearicum SK141]|uniref:Uncharacterized protein n=1 Tax=Corynebacterium tuberculostearicum SK141 TaxID=553206 RepID=C6RBF6_9CORY|nr:hypothetical protein CORTU0001_0522 [Corynebacterium tuberculostearicum SK141]